MKPLHAKPGSGMAPQRRYHRCYLDGALIEHGTSREFEQQVRARLPELTMTGITRR
jgi:hypothetical protein